MSNPKYHFVLVCPIYSNLRQKYIRPHYYNRPSVYKFTLSTQTKQQEVLQKLGKKMYMSLLDFKVYDVVVPVFIINIHMKIAGLHIMFV